MTIKETTKEKILAAARKEFSEKGLDGARVDVIAEAAGVNKAMIYYHFSSKEQLYDAILEEMFARVSAFIDRVLLDDLSIEARLEALSRAYVDIIESTPELPPIVLREMAAGGERVRRMLSRTLLRDDVPRRVRALLDEGASSGRIRPVDATHAVTSFIGMNLFYLFFQPVIHSIWEIHDEEAFRRSRPREVVDLFLRGLQPR